MTKKPFVAIFQLEVTIILSESTTDKVNLENRQKRNIDTRIIDIADCRTCVSSFCSNIPSVCLLRYWWTKRLFFSFLLSAKKIYNQCSEDIATAQQQPHPQQQITKTVVGLRLSDCWESPPPQIQNYMIEKNRTILWKQKLLIYMRRPWNSFGTLPRPQK